VIVVVARKIAEAVTVVPFPIQMAVGIVAKAVPFEGFVAALMTASVKLTFDNAIELEVGR